MSIKTDAMIAHNGANGYTLHVDYDPDTDDFELKAVFNDGTEKTLTGSVSDGTLARELVERTATSIIMPGVVTIGSSAITYFNYLKYVEFPDAEVSQAWGIYSNPALEIVILPKIKRLQQANIMTNNPSLQYVYLGPDCTTMNNIVFSATFVGVIDCGFSSTAPAAANAPWGATNATINYDVAEPNPPALSNLSISPDPGLIQNIDLEPVEDIQPVEPEPVVEVKKTKRSAK